MLSTPDVFSEILNWGLDGLAELIKNGEVSDGPNVAEIKLQPTCLRVLQQCGANLADPETVKEVLAKGKNTKGLIWSSNRKINLINAYTMFLKFQNQQWQKPKCRLVRPVPFSPTEQKLDSLIAGLGHKELRNTERYITIARTIFGPGTSDKFVIKVAAHTQEAIELGENGFEPFDVVDGVRLYRKRK